MRFIPMYFSFTDFAIRKFYRCDTFHFSPSALTVISFQIASYVNTFPGSKGFNIFNFTDYFKSQYYFPLTTILMKIHIYYLINQTKKVNGYCMRQVNSKLDAGSWMFLMCHSVYFQLIFGLRIFTICHWYFVIRNLSFRFLPTDHRLLISAILFLISFFLILP